MMEIKDEFLDVSDNTIEYLDSRVKKTNKPKSSKTHRCKDTIDWVEVEYGEEYAKPKRGEKY